MQIWRELLETAIHSPSPHNVQPWRVKIVNENEAELYIDSTRTLPKEDVTGSFIISAMGMFIEALHILAQNRRLGVTYELLHEPDWFAPAILESKTPELIPFAGLKLVPDENSQKIYDDDLFLKRRTSRLFLHDKTIPEESINKLKGLEDDWGQKFDITIDTEQIGRIMKLNTAALFEDLNSTGYHDEIVEWFRFTEKQSNEHLDGLDYRCMNTSPLNYWLIARFPKMLLLPLTRQILSKAYRSQLGKIPALGMISGGFWDPADAINAGRFLMRFWLETAVHNLYIHPYGNLVTNHKAAAAVKEELGIDRIWLIFKIGFSDTPPKSHRRPVEQILV
jgi:hypothetical protein